MRPILLILIFTVNAAMAQQAAPASSKVKKRIVQLGIYASPDIATMFVQTSKDFIAYSDRNKPKASYSFGLLSNMRIKPWFSVESGITYSNMGQCTRVDGPFWFGTGWDPVTGSFTPSEIDKVLFYDHFHFLAVPINLVFTAGKGKVKFAGTAGLTLAGLVAFTQSSVWITGNDRETHQLKNKNFNKYYNTFNVMPRMGLGVDVQLNNLLMLRLQPYAQMAVLQLPKNSTFKSYYFNAGLGTTLYFGL